jgi:hypothetical protein
MVTALAGGAAQLGYTPGKHGHNGALARGGY